MKPEILIWLFPIVFMIHEFEEIIFMRWWFRKNKESILIKYPKLGKRMVVQFESLSTEAFSLIVAEEFILASLIVIISVITSNYDLYFGLITAYSVHLLVHIIQTVAIRQYTPAIVTTILTGIFSVVVFIEFTNRELISFNHALIYSIVLTLVIFLNLNLMHRLIKRIEILT
ncbi:MAG: HXXEE domain-containing protein [Bacteroidetes bacterium]|nr:MAG: HXXEE domain-containing protein [Bacteroidota bacterium]